MCCGEEGLVAGVWWRTCWLAGAGVLVCAGWGVRAGVLGLVCWCWDWPGVLV